MQSKGTTATGTCNGTTAGLAFTMCLLFFVVAAACLRQGLPAATLLAAAPVRPIDKFFRSGQAPCPDGDELSKFESQEQMMQAGWVFSWQDQSTFRPQKEVYAEDLPISSYWGFRSHGFAAISLTLRGFGTAVLDYGNSFHTGNVVVLLNGLTKSTAAADTPSVKLTLPFEDGDILKIVQARTGVIAINGIAFVCSGPPTVVAETSNAPRSPTGSSASAGEAFANATSRGSPATTTAAPGGAEPREPGGYPSLFCFALTQPSGAEMQLVKSQLEKRVGIFRCDDYAIVSNETISLGQGVTTRAIGGSLKVPYGGKWGTALNTDIFVKVWQAIYELGTFARWDWTVKLDPDTVFFPRRLRGLLRDARDDLTIAVAGPGSDPSCPECNSVGSVYLNNCRFGLHGPIEVLSREAVKRLYRGLSSEGCQVFQELPIGEDKYLRRCLRTLGVRRVNQFGLLKEEACGQQKVTCSEPRVAFHPFKTPGKYFECWDLANAGDDAPPAQQHEEARVELLQ